jgi:hypothetical protein
MGDGIAGLPNRVWCNGFSLSHLRQNNTGVFWMKRFSWMMIVAATAMCLPAGGALAQSAPSAGTDAPAAPAAPAPAAAPAETSPPATKQKTARKKNATKMTRRQEIESSVESGTVPSRYRRQVPKEYQHYIPFAK